MAACSVSSSIVLTTITPSTTYYPEYTHFLTITPPASTFTSFFEDTGQTKVVVSLASPVVSTIVSTGSSQSAWITIFPVSTLFSTLCFTTTISPDAVSTSRTTSSSSSTTQMVAAMGSSTNPTSISPLSSSTTLPSSSGSSTSSNLIFNTVPLSALSTLPIYTSSGDSNASPTPAPTSIPSPTPTSTNADSSRASDPGTGWTESKTHILIGVLIPGIAFLLLGLAWCFRSSIAQRLGRHRNRETISAFGGHSSSEGGEGGDYRHRKYSEILTDGEARHGASESAGSHDRDLVRGDSVSLAMFGWEKPFVGRGGSQNSGATSSSSPVSRGIAGVGAGGSTGIAGAGVEGARRGTNQDEEYFMTVPERRLQASYLDLQSERSPSTPSPGPRPIIDNFNLSAFREQSRYPGPGEQSTSFQQITTLPLYEPFPTYSTMTDGARDGVYTSSAVPPPIPSSHQSPRPESPSPDYTSYRDTRPFPPEKVSLPSLTTTARPVSIISNPPVPPKSSSTHPPKPAPKPKPTQPISALQRLATQLGLNRFPQTPDSSTRHPDVTQTQTNASQGSVWGLITGFSSEANDDDDVERDRDRDDIASVYGGMGSRARSRSEFSLTDTINHIAIHPPTPPVPLPISSPSQPSQPQPRFRIPVLNERARRESSKVLPDSPQSIYGGETEYYWKRHTGQMTMKGG